MIVLNEERFKNNIYNDLKKYPSSSLKIYHIYLFIYYKYS